MIKYIAKLKAIRFNKAKSLIYLLFLIKKFFIGNRTNNIVIACFPKSASSYLNDLIIFNSEYKLDFYKPYYGIYNDFIDFCRFTELIDRKVVIQQHFRATEYNVKLLNEVNARIVVLVRNIFDVIISFRDHILKDKKGPLYIEQLDFFIELDEEDQYNYIIDFYLSFYITFYVTWYEDDVLDKVFIDYNDLVSNPYNVLQKIFNFYNLKDRNFNLDISKRRFNKGKSGRYKQKLKKYQIDKIKQMIRYHNNVDFSLILGDEKL